MAFKAEAIATYDKYKEQFKKELGRLKGSSQGEMVKFWYYADADLGGGAQPVLVFDDVAPPVLSTLKAKSKARALGTGFIEGSTLKLSPSAGKLPSAQIKELFKGLSFTCKVVEIEGIAEAEAPQDSKEEAALFAALNPLTDRYEVLVAKLGKGLPADLKTRADKALEAVSAEASAGKFEAGLKLTQAFRRILDDIETQAGEGVKDLGKAREALAKRFDAVKGNLPDDERKALHALFGAFDKVAGQPEAARKALFDIRDAVDLAEKQGVTPRQKLEADFKKIVTRIGKEKDRLSVPDGKKVAELLQSLSKEMAKPGYEEPARLFSLLEMTLDEALVATEDSRSTDRGDADTAQKALREAASAFDAIKGKVTDDARKELRVAFGQMADRMKIGKFAEVVVLAGAIQRRLAQLTKALEGGEAQSEEKVLSNAQARQGVLLQRRLDEQTNRLAAMVKIKGIGDTPAKTAKTKLEAVAKHLAEGKFAEANKALNDVEVTLTFLRKNLMNDIGKKEAEALKALANSATTDERDLASEIMGISEDIETAFGKTMTIATDISLLLKALDKATTQDEITDLWDEFDDLEEDAEDAQADLAKARKALGEKGQALKKMEGQRHPQLVATLKLAMERQAAAEEAVGELTSGETRSKLSALVKQMAEATGWREEQLKGPGHGTSRHGAQTGLERQARRAASTSAVTPDQVDNPGGAAQVLDWNGVKFTYTEKDGKRVVAKRDLVASKFAGVAQSGGPTTSKGSMWATPVLEKLAYDTGLKHANAMKAYTHYVKANNQRNDFTKFTAHIGPPSGQPGWGFSVERTGAAMSDQDATDILKEFEQGELTYDEMFRKMGVKMAGKGGAGDYVKFATVVFTRGAGGADWNLLTMYPNDSITAPYWECQKGWAPNNLRFDKGPGIGLTQVIPNTTMPG